ncbi:MAG: hypothetical protein SFU83_16170 [Meiothermus sp.]|nr:hypothetical protein [Meiothermus sp.]
MSRFLNMTAGVVLAVALSACGTQVPAPQDEALPQSELQLNMQDAAGPTGENQTAPSAEVASSSLLIPSTLVLEGGQLDHSFGNRGRLTLPLVGAGIWALAMQPDGRIVAGGFGSNGANTVTMLARMQSGGALDSSFGQGGRVLTAAGSQHSGVTSLAMGRDGKVLAGGFAQNYSMNQRTADFYLARYTAAGVADAGSFAPSGGGGLLTNFSFWGDIQGFTDDTLSALAVQPDGKIVAAGTARLTETGRLFGAVTRYNPDGSLDASFGNGGRVVLGQVNGWVWAMALQPDGKIVLGGSSLNAPSPGLSGSFFRLTRLLPGGQLDVGFGQGGTAITVVGRVCNQNFSSQVNALAVQSDGKIVAGGSACNGTFQVTALARYNADGLLDGSFGLGGLVITPAGTRDSSIKALALQRDRKIVVAGNAVNASGNGDLYLARYTAAGTADAADFARSGGGGLLTDFGGDERAAAVAIQPDGRILVGGQSWQGGTSRAVLARYFQ